MFAEIQSHVSTNNLMLTNNHVTGTMYGISRKTFMEIHDANVSGNNCKSSFLLMEWNFFAIVQKSLLI